MRLNTRIIFNAVIFFSIAFFSFTTVMFLLSLAVGDNLVFVPIDKDYYSAAVSTDTDSKKRGIITMGDRKDKLRDHNIFDSENRTIQFEALAKKNMKQSGGAGTGSDAERKQSENRQILRYFLNPRECPRYNDATLLATVIAIPYEESTASIKYGQGPHPEHKHHARRRRKDDGGGEEYANVVSVRHTIPETDITVSAIGRNYAILSTPSGIQCIGENVGEEESDAPKKKTAEAKKPRPSSRGGAADFDIRKIGDGRYVVKREDIMKATTNLNSLARQARIVPAPDGNGFKIFRIRPNSIYGKIGIQNGDVVKSINGIDISSPDKALQAYQKLRNADKISLNIIRNEQKESLEYVIE